MSLPPPRPTLFPYTTLFRSKGVLYTHRGAYLSALGNTQHYRLDGASKYLWTLPMFHCNGWTMTWGATATASTHICLRAVRQDAIWEIGRASCREREE